MLFFMYPNTRHARKDSGGLGSSLSVPDTLISERVSIENKAKLSVNKLVLE